MAAVDGVWRGIQVVVAHTSSVGKSYYAFGCLEVEWGRRVVAGKCCGDVAGH